MEGIACEESLQTSPKAVLHLDVGLEVPDAGSQLSRLHMHVIPWAMSARNTMGYVCT